jgi:hypothetical protein
MESVIMNKRIIFLAAAALGASAAAHSSPVRVDHPEALDALLKQFVAAKFKDPDSVKYQHVAAFKNDADVVAKYNHDAEIVVCGEVNAKNSFGAYTGFTKFMILPHGGGIIQPTASDQTDALLATVFVEQYADFCK